MLFRKILPCHIAFIRSGNKYFFIVVFKKFYISKIIDNNIIDKIDNIYSVPN